MHLKVESALLLNLNSESFGKIIFKGLGCHDSYARDISDDGLVVVGSGNGSSGPLEAFRWTESGGMEFLGDLLGGSFNSAARGVSWDGLYIVGSGHSSLGEETFLWTKDTGMVGLGDIPGGGFASTAKNVSGDGKIVIGRDCSIDTGIMKLPFVHCEALLLFVNVLEIVPHAACQGRYAG